MAQGCGYSVDSGQASPPFKVMGQDWLQLSARNVLKVPAFLSRSFLYSGRRLQQRPPSPLAAARRFLTSLLCIS